MFSFYRKICLFFLDGKNNVLMFSRIDYDRDLFLRITPFLFQFQYLPSLFTVTLFKVCGPWHKTTQALKNHKPSRGMKCFPSFT